MRNFTPLAVLIAAGLAIAVTASGAIAQPADSQPILSRHIEAPRADANKSPRGEADQAIVDGWPLYRTARGQAAFNAAMATLHATETWPPAAATFKGCKDLNCPISLPAVGQDGWLPAGRIWVSPSQFVLIAHSPRLAEGKSYRRRTFKKMEYFVLHEFNNSARNADPYDTISSHKSEVFVPLYMSKMQGDARGRHFVTVVQVAPYDVVSIHATNMDSNGPGMEVAKNAGDELEPLQSLAGILIATMIKTAAPHLEVVNHHGSEGLPMLEAYDSRLERLKSRKTMASITLPFVAAPARRVAEAIGRLADLVARPGGSLPVPLAARGMAPMQSAAIPTVPTLVQLPRPAVRPAPAAGGGKGT